MYEEMTDRTFPCGCVKAGMYFITCPRHTKERGDKDFHEVLDLQRQLHQERARADALADRWESEAHRLETDGVDEMDEKAAYLHRQHAWELRLAMHGDRQARRKDNGNGN